MQKGPTALGRPFPHELFVYFAAHDIETQSIVPRDGPIGHIAEIGEGTRGKSHTAAGFFADGIDEGRDELLFAGDNTFKPDGARFRRTAEGIFNERIGGLAVTHEARGLLDDIRQHEEHHGEAMLAAGLFEVRAQAALQLIELGAAHAVDLADTERDVAELELLVILIENFFRSLILEVAACGKHFDTEALTIDARNGTERFRCGAVQQGTGRRTEHERIGQNGAAQKTRDLRRNLKALFFINGIDDGRRAADGLVAEIHRCHRLEGADAVVIDDFQNFCVFDVFNRLTALIVID